MKKLALLLVILELLSTSCRPGAVKEPTRPAAVPKSAMWSGGPDGGAWFDCTFKADQSYNLCSVYHEGGTLWIRAKYRLKVYNRPATKDEFLDPGMGASDEIDLNGGKTLVTVEVLYVEH